MSTKTSAIETIYNCVLKHATELRLNNTRANGLLYWTRLKSLFASISHISAEAFLSIDKETYQRFMALPEKTIDGYGNITMLELNHFVIQLVRIPHNEEPSIIKILQLAYNYGQYVGTREKLLTKSGTFNGIENVDTIHKFISQEDIEKVDSELRQLDINIDTMCQDIKNAFSK
jgi:hypothetical protein